MGRRCLALCAEQHAARLRFGERQRSLPDRFAVEHRRQPDCLERRAAFGSDPAAGVRCPFVGAADDARSFTGDPHRRARCVVRCGQRRFQSERWHRRRSARMARLLVGMRFTAQSFPEYRTFLERIALRWNFCNLLTQDGQPLDGREQNGAWRSAAASDVGYADYNGAAFRLWGFQRTSTRTAPFKTAVVYGEPLAGTRSAPHRRARRHRKHPYLLTGLEMGWPAPHPGEAADVSMAQRAQRLYQAQETRWRREKILTARAQYSRSTAPWEVYDSLFANGYAWNTLADDGRYAPELALLSTRAIFGLWALWDTRYTDALMQLGRLHQDGAAGLKAVTKPTAATTPPSPHHQHRGVGGIAVQTKPWPAAAGTAQRRLPWRTHERRLQLAWALSAAGASTALQRERRMTWASIMKSCSITATAASLRR